MNSVYICNWIGEKIAAAQKDLALFVLFKNLGAVRCDIANNSIIVFLRQAGESHARVDDKFKEDLFLFGICDLAFIK